MKKIKKFRVAVRQNLILSMLKYKDDITEDADQLKDHIQKEVLKAYDFIQPAVVYDTFNISEISELYSDSKDVSALLKDSVFVTILVVTIGDALCKEIDALIEQNRVADASIWDAIGSEAVEQSANFVNRLVKEEAGSEGSIITPRFSAGYGDWGIKNNKKIIDILGAERIGVSVNEYDMLVPNKTITAVIGWEKAKKSAKKTKNK
ncbi:MAG: hypothetical protein ABH857_03555 [Elusimicrobiota bacterium]